MACKRDISILYQSVGWAKAPAVPIMGWASHPMGTRCFAHPTGYNGDCAFSSIREGRSLAWVYDGLPATELYEWYSKLVPVRVLPAVLLGLFNDIMTGFT